MAVLLHVSAAGYLQRHDMTQMVDSKQWGLLSLEETAIDNAPHLLLFKQHKHPVGNVII